MNIHVRRDLDYPLRLHVVMHSICGRMEGGKGEGLGYQWRRGAGEVGC